MGLRRIGDIARQDPAWLERRFAGGRHLWELARGIDPRPVVPDRAAKSVGAEDTFDEDHDRPALPARIHGQALRVGRRLRRAGVKARVVQLKIKLSDFNLVTRRTTLPAPTDDGQTLYRAAIAMLDRIALDRPVRLTGVAAHELAGDETQLGLFTGGPSKTERLNAALDQIADRYGRRAIVTADVAGLDDEDGA